MPEPESASGCFDFFFFFFNLHFVTKEEQQEFQRNRLKIFRNKLHMFLRFHLHSPSSKSKTLIHTPNNRLVDFLEFFYPAKIKDQTDLKLGKEVFKDI